MIQKYKWIFVMIFFQTILMIVSILKNTMVLAGIFLLSAAFIFMILTIIDLLRMRKADPEWFDTQYFFYVAVIFLYMLVIHFLLLIAGNKAWDWNNLFVVVYSVFVILIGNFTPRIPFKSLMGIWIPWLFKSELRWRRAHRIAGFIYSGFGVLFILLIIVDFRIQNISLLIVFYIIIPLLVASLIPAVWVLIIKEDTK